MRTFLTLLLCLVLISSQAFPQNKAKSNRLKGNCSIQGLVLDSATNAAMPYVTVMVLNPRDSSLIDGALTKKDGEFIVDNLPYGEFDVKYNFVGYQPQVFRNIRLSADNSKITLPQVLLREKTVQTSGVVVEGEKVSVSYKLDKKVINISGNPNVQGGTVADALQNDPSVSVDMEGNISLRGSQNFQVLIDGKPSPMPGTEALKSIPASALESIEIITNPSAKYDPDGTAGIINLVLQKMDLNGMNGIVNGTVGSRDKYNSDASFNCRLNDFNYYGSLQYNSMTNRPASTMTRVLYNDARDTSYYINPVIERKMKHNDISARAGVEYNIDPTRFVALAFNVNKLDFLRFFPTKMREWSEPASTDKYYLNTDEYTVRGYYNTANAFFRQEFEKKGQQLSTNLNVIYWDGYGNESTSKSVSNLGYTPSVIPPVLHNGHAYSRTVMLKYKADFSWPISDKYKLETGYNFDYTQDFSDYLFQDYDNNTKLWQTNSNYTNNTKYFHSINALYGMFSGELWDLGYQFGLRAEYFNRRLSQTTNNLMYKYEKVNVFPTVHVSKNFTDGQQIQLSYSRRVQRPDVYALNPFPDYVDDYVVSVGNPNLMPEFTDSYEINYQKPFDFVFLSAQAYYRQTDNAMTRVLRVKENNQLWITSENVSAQYLAGAELGAYFTFFKKLKLNLAANLYRFSIVNHDKSIEETSAGNVLDGNIMVSYPVMQNTIIQLNAFYMGPKFTTDGRVDDTYALGFTARQYLFDKKLTIILNGRNVFNTMKFTTENLRQNYYAYSTNYMEGANFSLGFSLNLNNYENKQRPEDTIEGSTNAGASGGY